MLVFYNQYEDIQRVTIADNIWGSKWECLDYSQPMNHWINKMNRYGEGQKPTICETYLSITPKLSWTQLITHALRNLPELPEIPSEEYGSIAVIIIDRVVEIDNLIRELNQENRVPTTCEHGRDRNPETRVLVKAGGGYINYKRGECYSNVIICVRACKFPHVDYVRDLYYAFAAAESSVTILTDNHNITSRSKLMHWIEC